MAKNPGKTDDNNGTLPRVQQAIVPGPGGSAPMSLVDLRNAGKGLSLFIDLSTADDQQLAALAELMDKNVFASVVAHGESSGGGHTSGVTPPKPPKPPKPPRKP